MAQNPANLFRQPPQATAHGPNGSEAYTVDVDTDLLASGATRFWLDIPGRADMLAEQDGMEQRGSGNLMWRGRVASESDSRIVITRHNGLVVGMIQSGDDSYTIYPGPNGESILEKIDHSTFAPEWGHDDPSRDKVPPAVPAVEGAPGADSTTTTISSEPATSADAADQILLMSLYTAQARDAVGGVAQIEARIQAAVDQANTAFQDSNMVARFVLAHTGLANRKDTGSIEQDLYWVTGDAGVDSLRNTHSADMVSLIVKNGGPYCGIAWVQRSPGSSFATHAFQVSDLDCLANSTFAHEHGHNMGFEHNPENSSVGTNPSAASYDWAFGHYVNGSFRTIMSYSNPCTLGCGRALKFSNPDILHNGFASGIDGQRDNARAGDSTAPIVANFRLGGGTGGNNPPSFITDPITGAGGELASPYSGSIGGSASDPDSDPLSYSKTAGAAWLNIASNGDLSGTPDVAGMNSFTLNVSDGNGGSDSATLEINVIDSSNNPPVFTTDPIDGGAGTEGSLYSGAIGSSASDPDSDPLSYSKMTGPSWLNVASNGDLSGTPDVAGMNSFTVNVSDGNGGSDSATLTIDVAALPAPPAAPNKLKASLVSVGRGKNKTYTGEVELTWNDNSINEDNFVIETCTGITLTGRGKKKTASCTGVWSATFVLGSGVTSHAYTPAAGTTILYRVMARNANGDSDYSNEASVTTP